ncbi:MAG: BatD family protein [Bacteroidota bacterium]
MGSFIQLNAQSATAQVSTKQVQVGVPFEYAVVINANATECTPPNFKGFDVVSGPNQSSSMQFVNGQSSFQLTLTWIIAAQKEGKYTLGSAAVRVGAQILETKPIGIEVLKGSANQSNQGGNQSAYNTKIGGADVFIRTGINKNKCYLGEQVTIVQKVYSRYEIVGFQKFAAIYDGFYSLPQDNSQRSQPAMENVDGINYYTYELYKTIGIANKQGKISISPIAGDVIVRRQAANKPKNFFEQFFGVPSFEDIPVSVKSKPLGIEVLPLPEEGKPENFSGAVGSFMSKVEVSRTELKANEAFNLKMTISGRGNLKLINAPKINLPDGFETYDPKVIENANAKTFDYLVIPRNEGEFELKNLDFSFFNLDTKKYVILPAGEIKIKVLPGDANAASAQVYSSHNQIKETENDIRYIKKGNFKLEKGETEFFHSSAHMALIVFPILALIIALFVRHKHVQNNSNVILVNERKAAKMAKKQLMAAEKFMHENNKDAFYTEVLLALQNYLSHKLNIAVADLSKENIQNILTQRKIDEQIKNKVIRAIETSEYAKYAPGAVSGDLQMVYAGTSELIVSLEQQLNKKAA